MSRVAFEASAFEAEFSKRDRRAALLAAFKESMDLARLWAPGRYAVHGPATAPSRRRAIHGLDASARRGVRRRRQPRNLLDRDGADA